MAKLALCERFEKWPILMQSTYHNQDTPRSSCLVEAWWLSLSLDFLVMADRRNHLTQTSRNVRPEVILVAVSLGDRHGKKWRAGHVGHF